MLITCCEIIIKCKVKEKYTIPFLYTTREKRGKEKELINEQEREIN